MPSEISKWGASDQKEEGRDVGQHGLRFLPLPNDLGNLSHTVEWEAAVMMQERFSETLGFAKVCQDPRDERVSRRGERPLSNGRDHGGESADRNLGADAQGQAMAG